MSFNKQMDLYIQGRKNYARGEYDNAMKLYKKAYKMDAGSSLGEDIKPRMFRSIKKVKGLNFLLSVPGGKDWWDKLGKMRKERQAERVRAYEKEKLLQTKVKDSKEKVKEPIMAGVGSAMIPSIISERWGRAK